MSPPGRPKGEHRSAPHEVTPMSTPCVAVAYSAGRDSTALLHVTARVAATLGIEVVALHVHHGLHGDADAWLEHCTRQCATWARRGLPIRLLTHRVQAKPPRGASVEAWARGERYRALEAMAQSVGATLVLLAHHRRDQAETFLLQALRGAGVAGLAAMPAQRSSGAVAWARPWLQQPRQRIESYLRRHRLHHVDDSSNVEPRFSRNRLRSAVWPALVDAFPGAESALSDAATWAAQASALLDEIADADLVLLDAPGWLDLERWRRLSPARRRNALRRWLADRGIGSAALLERLCGELVAARPARWQVDGGAELRSYRGRLRGTAPR
jgi:tRNA(Ile)-lysidine synthase